MHTNIPGLSALRHLGLTLLFGAAAVDTADAQTPLRVGSEFVVNTYTTGAQQESAVAGAGSSFVVVWETSDNGGVMTTTTTMPIFSSGIAGRRFAPSGTPFGNEFPVNTTATADQLLPAVAGAPDGRFVVVWQSDEGGSYEIFGQRYDAGGAPAGSEFFVNSITTSDQSAAHVAMGADGGFVVVWKSDFSDGIYVRRFASDATPLGPEVTVDTAPTFPARPGAAALSGGGFVVVWEDEDLDDRGVLARLYDASGAPTGPQFVVNGVTTNAQWYPALAATTGGEFVVVWQDQDSGDIQGRLFTSAGSPVGSDFTVNSSTTGFQYRPAVAAVADGGFVVVWSDEGDLTGQRFDASAAPVGGEFVVNPPTPLDEYPVIAGDVGGSFLVTWERSGGDGSGSGVIGQRYVLDRQPGSVVGAQKISDFAGIGGLDDGDRFGDSVAALGDVDGDGVTDLAVGSSFDDDGGTSTGALRVVFLESDGTVKGEQKISQTFGGFGGALDDDDRFGQAVAGLGDLDGDGVPDLAVGASGDDDGGSARGAIWVLFLNADGTVKAHQKISDLAGAFAGVLDDGDRFGSSAANLGDLDGDDVTDLVVGAALDFDGGFARGAVWVLFLNPNGTVKTEQKISQISGGFNGALENGDAFGSAVAALGDLDGDGVPDLAVGASNDDDGNGGSDRGAVWVLRLNADGTVKAEQKISDTAGGFAGSLADLDRFGSALAALGDLDGDGASELAVGTPQGDDGGPDRGAVWVLFLYADGIVKAQEKISDVFGGFTGGLDDGDRFGSALAAIGDLDGDGETDLAVGTPEDDDGGAERGAVWILFHNGTPVVELNVTYTEPEIVSGPLSFGLAALPPSVTTTFRFVTPSWPPPLGVALTPTVLAASSTYGDARWTTADLQSFSVTFGSPSVITALTYAFGPINTAAALDGIQLNDFELHVSGTDRVTKQPFEYRHDRSAEEPTQVAATPCPSTPDPACVTGFTGGLLSVDERIAGAEKVFVKWTGGPELAGTDFGNPLAASGTAYRLCVYDDDDALVGRYVVDRAGYLCGTKPCWKALGKPPGDPAHKGYKYKDAAVGADGVLLVKLKGGGAGQTKALVRAKNLIGTPPALPTGVAAKLAGATGATVQLLGSGAPECVSATLPTVVLDEGDRFKAKN
jgi:hypothetical protein